MPLLTATQTAQLARLTAEITNRFKTAFREQGHSLTGESERAMEGIVREQGAKICLEFMFLDRNNITDQGVKASRIKYQYARARIAGLTQFALDRGLASSAKQAKQIAYAIATKHKQEGMHTKASRRFSSTGKREGFISDTITEIESDLTTKIENIFFTIVQLTFEKELRKIA